jgi:putative FmdB family regulatory protein
MPLYDYACTKCGHIVEVRHGFDESYDKACTLCGAPVRRVFNAAPVLFKGSGFYVTDSRHSTGSGKAEKPKSETGTPSEASSDLKSDSGSTPKADAPKAAPKASEPAA